MSRENQQPPPPELTIFSKDRPTPIETHTEVILSMEHDTIAPLVETWFPPTINRWLPQKDIFWEAGAEDEEEKRAHFRRQAINTPDELLIAVIGDEVTEEYLPGYMIEIGRLSSLQGRSGTDQRPLSRGLRLWTRDEWGHGAAFGIYRREHPKIDSNAVDRDILYFFENGFDSKSGQDPYAGYFYTTGQELLTEIAHGNVMLGARQVGDETLAKIARKVKGDERRHFEFYRAIGQEVFKRDPEGAATTLWNVLRFGIVMPGARMGNIEGAKHKSPIFQAYSEVMESTGILTFSHYLDMYKTLLTSFGIEHLQVSGEAAKARDNLMNRYYLMEKQLDQHMTQAREIKPEIPFAWIRGRSVSPSHPTFKLKVS